MVSVRNDYESAFAAWLAENGVRYVSVDQSKRSLLVRNRIKSFDFLVYPGAGDQGPTLLVTEVKGRLFKGKSLTRLSGLQCWVTIEDIVGLSQWQDRFDEPREKAKSIIVFAYRLELPVVETDGREIFEFSDHRYMFYAVGVDEYRRHMKVRSPCWRTVTLPAADFRRLGVPVRQLMGAEY